MHPAIRQRLNTLNREFYRITAHDFDQTRQEAWRGWDGLLPHLQPRSLNVLDIGCGNGRFGVFLAQHIGTDWHYHGVDNSPALLERAALMLHQHAPGLPVTLENRDLVNGEPFPPDTPPVDVIGLFGVLHHIPGAAERQRLMQRLAGLLAPGGLFAFACWRFYEFERFRERLIPWAAFDPELAAAIEPGDYLLDWRRGATAVRYCHFVDDAEHAALVAATGLTEIATYRADGQTGTVNRYSILVNC